MVRREFKWFQFIDYVRIGEGLNWIFFQSPTHWLYKSSSVNLVCTFLFASIQGSSQVKIFMLKICDDNTDITSKVFPVTKWIIEKDYLMNIRLIFIIQSWNKMNWWSRLTALMQNPMQWFVDKIFNFVFYKMVRDKAFKIQKVKSWVIKFRF